MSKFIDWSDKLSVAIEIIDEQHKVLVDLINHMHDAIVEQLEHVVELQEKLQLVLN